MQNKNKQSNIAAAKVGLTKQSVIAAVDNAMELANCRNYLKPLKGRTKIFLKVNLLSHQVVPGHCTSPYVLEGVILKLRQIGNFDIYVGDADVATIKQVDLAAQNWGIIDVCRNYGAKFVNLSKQPVKEVDFNGEIFKKIYVPQILADVDYIITIPVPKTHNVSTMSCALKNQWGCLPRFRQQYHNVVHKAIAELNKCLAVDFAVCDATVGSEGEGPRTSTPKVCDYIFVSNDLVAMDSFVADFIGVSKKDVGHIYFAEKLDLGNISYKILGSKKAPSCKFRQAVQKNHPVVFVEMKLRKVPVLNYLLFKTFLFKAPAWLASRYNSIYWYRKEGKKCAEDLIKNYPLYRTEFSELIKNQKDITI